MKESKDSRRNFIKAVGVLGVTAAVDGAQGLEPVTLTADISCGTTWSWQNLTSMEVFGVDQNPVQLGSLLDEDTVFEIVVDSGTNRATVSAQLTVLVSNDPEIYDPNGDGCNSINDLYFAIQDWQSSEGIDANNDGATNVLDFLFVNTSSGCP